MLSRSQMLALLDAAAEHGLFVLLEAFDAADLHAARELLAARTPARAGSADILLGINSRDLRDAAGGARRFEALAPRLPPIGRPWRRAASHPRPTPCACCAWGSGWR